MTGGQDRDGGGVAEWLSGRGILRVGAIPAFLSFLLLLSSTCLWIHQLYHACTAIPRLFSSHPSESLTHFAPELCRIVRVSFWRGGVGSGSPSSILAVHASWRPHRWPAVTWLNAPTPCTFGTLRAFSIARSVIEIVSGYLILRGRTLGQFFSLSLKNSFFILDYHSAGLLMVD